MVGFVGRLARYMLQVAIEVEATAFLGREHYRRGARERMGWRNGYEPKQAQSEAGRLELAMPQLRGTPEPFQPKLTERLQTRTTDLESLVRGMYVRGLSTQDVSALFADTFGVSRLSKSTVSRVTQQLNHEFETWRRRDLSDLSVVYLFLDGQYHAARQGSDEKEGVLSAYALLEDGRPLLLHLDLGPRESYDAWLSFLQDLVARGLREPLLVVMDGAPGLVKAVRRVWPRAYRQRCQVHKMRNILAKLPRLMQAKMKGRAAGLPAVNACGRGEARAGPHCQIPRPLSAAMECLARDLEECVTYLQFPEAHRRRIRTTNRLERLNGEGRRRTKVIPRFPTERSCLTLLFATLMAASKQWRGVPMTPAMMRQVESLREAAADASVGKQAVA